MTVLEYYVELICSICSPRKILNQKEKEGWRKEGMKKKRNGSMRDKGIEERQRECKRRRERGGTGRKETKQTKQT